MGDSTNRDKRNSFAVGDGHAESVCVRIRAARERAGLSQSEASRRMGWRGNSRLATYEGGREPPLGVLEQLASLYGTTPAALAFGTTEAQPIITVPGWRPSGQSNLLLGADLLAGVFAGPHGTTAADLLAIRVPAGQGYRGVAENGGVVVVDARAQMREGTLVALKAGPAVTLRSLSRISGHWYACHPESTHPWKVVARDVIGSVVLVVEAVRR